MTDPFYSSEPQKESNSLINYLIAGFGIVMMLCACSLVPLILVRNGRFQTVQAAQPAHPFVYTGQQVHNVPAGSRRISALSHSSEAAVIVMFDADW